jgi:hypothetical protein
MQGFRPATKRPAAQHLAEGGLVRGLVRRVMGIPEPAAAAPSATTAPAPASAPERALTQYAGMSATERRMKAAGLKDGGPVRGPGTGTSDSIETEVRPGSYILPADTTEQLGEQNIEAMGFQPEKVPVNLSNGEYQLPPEQVHAVGVQALDAIKDATHAPASQARGFAPGTVEPPMFFADGGEVEDPEKRARQAANTGIRYEERQPGLGLLMRAQAAAPPPPAAPPATNPLAQTQGAAFGVFRREPTAGSRGGMMQPYVATGPATFEPARVQTGSGRMDAFTDPRSMLYKGGDQSGPPTTSRGFAGVGEGWGSGARDMGSPAAAAAPAVRPAAMQPAPASAPVPADATPLAGQAPSSEAAPSEVMPGVFRQGNSYGDSQAAAAAGFAPRSGPSAQNMAAADALEARGIAERVGERAASEAGGRGFQPAGGLTVIGDDSHADRVRRSAFAAAATPYANSQGRQLTANQVRTLAGMDEANARDVLARDTTAANNAASLAREAVQQEGAFERTATQEAGANTRAASTDAVQRGELALRQEAQGFQSRAAQDQEALRRVIMDPKAPAADRARAQQSLMALQGKDPNGEWSLHVTPATKNLDGSTSEGSALKINRATGEVQRLDGLGQRANLPTGMARQVGTAGGKPVYEDAQGRRFIGG